MFSRHTLLIALITAPAVLGAVLVGAVPAQAVTSGLAYYSNTSDRTIAVYSSGATKVRVKCNGSRDCVGYASYRSIAGVPNPSAGTYYKVGHGRIAYITVKLTSNQIAPTLAGLGSRKVEGKAATLRFAQTSPARTQILNSVTLTKRSPGVPLEGHVTGPAGTVTNLKVFRWNVSGLRTTRAQSATVDGSGYFDLGQRYQLGINNTISGRYRLSLQGTVNGETREWFWRGNVWGTGTFAGGSKDIREGSPVYLNRDRDFEANFNFNNITGHVSGTGSNGADVDVAGAPYSMPTVKSDLRALDYPYCANNFATTTTDGLGNYTAKFLPAAGDRRYAVHVTPSSGSAGDLWNDRYGSCLSARNYFIGSRNHNAFLIPSPSNQDANLRVPTGIVDGEVHSSGFSVKKINGGTYGDRVVTLREVIPGRTILDSPILASTQVTGSTNYYKFPGVKPGRYWLESGRVTGCAAYYPSIYPNNNLYLEGLDRGAEIWKAFTTLSQLYTDSGRQHDGYAAWHAAYAHGATTAVQGHRPSGKAGWMYRDFCKTNSAGKYQAIWVSTQPNTGTPGTGDWTRTTVSVQKGAQIAGHVSRGSKSNKEMLVTVYSTQGVRVARTAYTNSAGNFRIYGVAPGNYHVEVNADSWRGIGRTFTGPHYKSVSGSGAYSVGTLSAKF